MHVAEKMFEIQKNTRFAHAIGGALTHIDNNTQRANVHLNEHLLSHLINQSTMRCKADAIDKSTTLDFMWLILLLINDAYLNLTSGVLYIDNFVRNYVYLKM